MKPKTTVRKKFIFRYTELRYLLEMLEQQKITFLSPEKWDDKNDASLLLCSRQKSSLLAVCFTEALEAFHLWKGFSGGSNGRGVRIEFDKKKLIKSLKKKLPSLESGKVRYLRIKQLEKGKFRPEKLPFLKRLPYKDEAEFRIICEGNPKDRSPKSVPFDISSIRRITLSPWMPDSERKIFVSAIHAIPGCAKIKVSSSTLIENERWAKALVSKQKQ